jgi:hypothetical protein
VSEKVPELARSLEAKKRAARAYFERNRNNPEWRAKRVAWQREWRRANPQAYAQMSYRFAALKRKCNYCDQEMGFTFKQYRELVENKPCEYCGVQSMSFGVGLDRVDSTKGYVLGNCVPCCYLCNVMKSNMTLETFFEQCERIVDFRKR